MATVALLVGMAALTPWPAGQAEPTPKAQTACPVMGFDINRDIFREFKAKRVYFCCPACPPEFRKKPEFYMAAMQRGGVLLEDVPAKTS